MEIDNLIMKILNKNFLIATWLILCAVILRIVFNKLQWWNFSPITAMALFAGYAYTNKRFSFLIPIAAMLLSDLYLGLHSGMIIVYTAIGIVTLIGLFLSGKSIAYIIGGSLVSSVFFYLYTNLVFWYSPELYPISWSGQIQSYLAALPFFKASVVSDLMFTGILFGVYHFIKQRERAPQIL